MMNAKVMRYFYVSFSIGILCLIGIYFFTQQWALVYTALVLSILEVSLSFDNAVINAKVLSNMDKIWQKRFLLWGILIAVFGMRFVFPILLVTLTTGMGIVRVFDLAIYNPLRYGQLLNAGYPLISSFGAGFLLGVFFEFLFSPHKKIHWLRFIEGNFVVKKLSTSSLSALIFSVVVGCPFIYFLHSRSAWVAFFLGVVCQYLLMLLNRKFSGKLSTQGVIKYGVVGFIYLEVLDASFSFDGVIGAFAITTNILIIMVGLGIGALFVRSLTIYFVEQKVLQKFIYLEHGAHYAILFLAVCIVLKNFIHLPEALVGGVSIVLIVMSWLHSLYANRKS